MGEERSSGKSKGKGRRRYFQPNRNKAASSPQPATSRANEPAKAGKDTGQNRTRRSRRRARSRQRPAEDARTLVTEMDVDYVPPETVYVYTYSSNPELRDAYEFRPEHFSNVGRRLDDYDIDLSKLFQPGAVAPDGAPVLVETVAKPTYNWEDWEEPGETPSNQIKE